MPSDIFYQAGPIVKDESPAGERKIVIKTDRPASSVSAKLVARLVSDRKVPLTHSKCYEHLSLPRFDAERDVDQRHVQRLYDEMAAGRFLWDQVILNTAKLGKKVYQINGQHTCWARLNTPDVNHPRVLYREYAVDSEDQLRRLYGVIDAGKPRTPGHVLRVLLCGNGEFEGLWSSLASTIASGFRLWRYEAREENRRKSPHDIASEIGANYADVFNKIAAFVQGNYGQKHLIRAAVVGAMFATFDAKPSVARELWTPVADGLGLDAKGDARYRLREVLQRVQSAKSSIGIGGARLRLQSSEEIYRICILAWNKWRAGDEVESLRPTSKRFLPK
jgi:hypothetical protein